MSRTRLAAHALTGLLVEDVVGRAVRSWWVVANALAGVAVQVSVRAAVLSVIPTLTHTLAGFQVQFLTWTTHIS